MRVLLVSPSSADAGAPSAGGVAGYTGDLAAALRDSGHDVAVVSSGWAYAPRLLGRDAGPCRARRLDPLGGIDRFEIVNSPVLAPALWQFGGPEDEAACPPVERAFARVLSMARPEIVHIQGFEGFSAGIVRVAKRAGAACVVSLHNHHVFCSQVYLMRGRRTPCLDYEGGLACESCETAIDRRAERRRRATKGTAPPPTIAPPKLPPVQTFHPDGSPTPGTRRLWSYDEPTWRPMLREVPDAVAAQRTDGRYGRRRGAFVDALNRADRVLAVSNRVAEIAEAMGVSRARTEVLPIGSWAGQAERTLRPPDDPGPLRLIFLGFNNYYKGLPMLVDALGLLVPELRSRVHLAAHGPGCHAIRERAESLVPALAGLELGGTYRREDLSTLLDHRHAGVVPSVWSDNGPQTAIEMRGLGLPVLGARAGGIPDIIEHGTDGLLFRANDRCDLARTIAHLVRDRSEIVRLRGSVRPWISLSQHADAIADVYGRALS